VKDQRFLRKGIADAERSDKAEIARQARIRRATGGRSSSISS
jgi:hypothetical protein